jgi:hypothetical protein
MRYIASPIESDTIIAISSDTPNCKLFFMTGCKSVQNIGNYCLSERYCFIIFSAIKSKIMDDFLRVALGTIDIVTSLGR